MKTRLITLIVASLFVINFQTTPAKAASDQQVIGTLIGAAVGGFLGSNVGKGKGQLAATAIGTLLGAGIGNSVGSQNQNTNTVYHPQPRVVYEPRRQPRQQVVYVKQKPRTKHVVVHHVYHPKHQKAKRWQQTRRSVKYRHVYYHNGHKYVSVDCHRRDTYCARNF